VPTYSTNMNTALGELEFKLNKDQVTNLLNQSKRSFYILVKNPNGSKYTFYEGTFSSVSNKEEGEDQIANYQREIGNLNKQLVTARSTISKLEEELTKSSSKIKKLSSANENISLTKQPLQSGSPYISTKESQLAKEVERLSYENLLLTKKTVSLSSYESSIKKPRKPTKTVTPKKELTKTDYEKLRGVPKRVPEITPEKKIPVRTVSNSTSTITEKKLKEKL
ncbi:hypothetical protein KY334_01230, partial [Candidatus Woesearchaeota archaeon]|nr:hypothetical protein [Candidatus Woesearchaeota archaeon]